jgi:hypothetical protein
VPCPAAWAKSTPLATERNQVFMMAFGALHPQESMLQTATFEILGKFLLYMQGKAFSLHGQHFPEFR